MNHENGSAFTTYYWLNLRIRDHGNVVGTPWGWTINWISFDSFSASRYALELWCPCSFLLNGSGVGGWDALITHLHLLPRSRMSETTLPLCHMPWWCRNIRHYLYLNLTLFSLCITYLSLKAQQRHSPQSTSCHPWRVMVAYQLAWEH